MADTKKLIYQLEAQNAKYLKALDQAQKKLDRFAQQTKKHHDFIRAQFNGLRSAAVRLGVTLGAVFSVRAVIETTKKQQAALTQLRQAFVTTGDVGGHTFEHLIKKAEELQKVTIFGDEEIIDAQAKLKTFTKIADDEFDKTIELAADLSVRMGQDLKSSVVQLGKALNDPVANLGALSRSGIQFSKQQKEMIKDLFESGQVIEAQKIILKELETQFGGSARAARNDFGGALKALGNAAGDLLEADNLGGVTNSINDLTTLLQDPQTIQSAQSLTSGLIKGFEAAVKAISATVNGIREFSEFVAKTFGGVDLLDQGELNKLLQERQTFLKAIAAEQDKLGNSEQSYNDVVIQGMMQRVALLNEEIKKRKEAISFHDSFQKPADTGATTGGDDTFGTLVDLPARAGTVEALPLRTLNVIELDDAYKNLTRTLESLRTPQQIYNQAMAEAQMLLEAGAVTQEQYNQAVVAYGEELKESSKKTKDATNKISIYWDEATRNMQGILADWLLNFDDGLKGLVKSFARAMAQMAAQAAAAKIFELFGIGQSSGGNTTASAAASFAGAFAGGGGIPAGSWGIAGEAGMPELVTGPAHVYSGSQTSRMMGDNIVVNIDARNADPMAAAQMIQLKRVIENEVFAKIADRKQRGRF